MVGSIMVVGVLTRCVLFHSVCDLKHVQITVQNRLIWKFMLYEFELGQDAAETTKKTFVM